MKEAVATTGPSVCVIIAAYNAASTIARAIDSALAERAVAEVMVVDDASTDATVAAARACDDGTGRLTVRRLEQNGGPSRARNIAIAESTAPFLAILDSDDFFLPGRFAALIAVPDWDMIADNIAFIDEGGAQAVDVTTIGARRASPRLLSAAAFVEGCITRADRYKGELGFLKPLLSRAFLDRHALRYDEGMRLSEDYDLYVRALMAGARFRIAAECHYVAVERAGSLSAVHGIKDLTAVEAAATRLLAAAPADNPDLHRALQRHLAQVGRKRRHRAVLARKREVGIVRALREQARTPGEFVGVMLDVIGDKLRGVRPQPTPGPEAVRFLL